MSCPLIGNHTLVLPDLYSYALGTGPVLAIRCLPYVTSTDDTSLQECISQALGIAQRVIHANWRCILNAMVHGTKVPALYLSVCSWPEAFTVAFLCFQLLWVTAEPLGYVHVCVRVRVPVLYNVAYWHMPVVHRKAHRYRR